MDFQSQRRMQPIQSNVADTLTFNYVKNNADCKDIFHEFIDNINYEEVCYNDIDNGPKYTNDNLLDFINLYCNENLTPLFFSISNMSNTESRNHNYTAQCKFSDNPQVMNVRNEHQCVFILNQSEEKTVANKKLETQILNKHSNFNEEEAAITMKYSDSLLNEQTTILAQLSPKNNERQHYELDEKRGIIYRNFSIIGSVNSQKDHVIKKDENFHKKLMSLINHDEVNKLSGEIYSLEYYRSCNKLLAKKSRPLANLRQKNHDAEKKHKALVDLNKKCRSIIRKFKNGLFTIDTIFKWNESHSKDGPMNCSICRCNKFFKRPGSIANHIYRVHERILQEALERGELHEILKNSGKSKKNCSTKNDQNISYDLQVDQSCYESQNTFIHETPHENSQLFSDRDLSINNWGLPLKLDIHNQYLTSNADLFELEHALKIIE
ncbi:uncharacterized protein LOC103572023 isoform X2 [Microplitis demolitor]|uniref:uncharacterized protein LOC103572023 isoform X2 n=1 Tax=Microplitis demolitor TaxID=69319 RepID=UPI0006D522EC|nr:uncharacterized protein LOC103572023 isoform X2 [Microplitis demolitor]